MLIPLKRNLSAKFWQSGAALENQFMRLWAENVSPGVKLISQFMRPRPLSRGRVAADGRPNGAANACLAMFMLLAMPAAAQCVGAACPSRPAPLPGAVAAVEGYRIDAGDVLEFSVTGIADLRQRLTVDVNGRVQVPLAGDLQAAGLPLAELQERLRDALSTNFYQQRLPDGRNAQLVISRDEILLRIVEYRPVYLLGDVSRPGETPFRPGMTVLQAIALGGGYDLQRFRMSNPVLESIDLRSEIDVLRNALARAQVLAMRLEAERAGASAFNPEPSEVAAAPPLFREIVALETQQFTVRRTDFQNELASIQQLRQQAEAKLRSLQEQQRREVEGARADASESDRLRGLVREGVANTARAVETRRLSLLSSTRALQTSVEIEQTRREQEELARRVQMVTTQRDTEILRSLQEAIVQVATARSRLAAANEKAMFTSMLRSQLGRGRAGRPEITVNRQLAEGRARLVLGEDAPLLPGDVIEVALLIE